MLFLGHPVEIWAGLVVSIIVKLKASKALTIVGAITTTIVGLGAGVLTYQWALKLLGLDESWSVPLAILIALTAENIMKNFVEISADSELLKSWASIFINKKAG